MALFSGEKKNTCALHDFLCIFARNRMTPCVPNVHGNHYTSTYFILLSDRLIFRNSLSLEKKRVRVTAHYACVNVHISRSISWIATSGHK